MAFKIEIRSGNNTISFGPRFPGQTGRDILVVKHALGIVQTTPDGIDSTANDLPSAGIPLDTQQWFDCKTGSGIDIAQASLFDLKLSRALRTYQIKNQFLILCYLFEKNSIKDLVNMSNEDYADTIEQQQLDESILQQIDVIQHLFDRELGVLGEATIAVMHGWLPHSIVGNIGYNHDRSVYSSSEVVTDIIPEVLYKDFIESRLSQSPNDLWALGGIEGSQKENSIEKLEYYEEKVSESLAWIKRGRANFKYGSIDYNPNFEYQSVLYSSSLTIMEVVSTSEALAAIAPENNLSNLRRSLYPDPFTSTDPFYIDSETTGVYIETEFLLSPEGPLPNNNPETISELEARALIHVLKFFNKPDYAWFVLNDEITRTVFFAGEQVSPSHSGAYPQSTTRDQRIQSVERYQEAHQRVLDNNQRLLEIERSYPNLNDLIRKKEIIDAGRDVPPGTVIPFLEQEEIDVVRRYERIKSTIKEDNELLNSELGTSDRQTAYFIYGTPTAVQESANEGDQSIQPYTDGDVISGVSPLVKFIEYKTPSLRPGQPYRALFEINKQKLDLIQEGIYSYQIRLEEQGADSPELVEVCEDLNSREADRTLEEYRLHAKKRRREIVRKLRDAINKRNEDQFKPGATGPGQIDLGSYGPFDLNRAVLGPFGLQAGGGDYEYTSKVISALTSIGDAGIDALFGEDWETLGKLAQETDDQATRAALLGEQTELEISMQELKERIQEAQKDLKDSERILKREGIILDPKSKFKGYNEANLLSNTYSEIESILSRYLDSTGRSADSTFLTTAGPEQLEKVVLRMSFSYTATGAAQPGPKNGKVLDRLNVDIDGEPLGENLVQTTFFEQSQALKRPRTVNYLSNIKEMTGAFTTKPNRIISFLDDNRGSCRDLGINLDKRLAMSFLSKYTSGIKVSEESSKSMGKAWHSWYKSNFKDPATQWADQSVKNLKASTNDTFDENQALRALGKLTAWEDLYKEFFDKLSLPSLLCDYLKCIKLPGIDLKLPSFYLPPLPSVPIVGWYGALIEFLKEEWYQILMRFLQTWVRGVIDKLAMPFCQEQLSEFIAAGSLSGSPAADMALRDSLLETGIPGTRVDDSKSFFDDVSRMVTGQEICHLFSGRQLDQAAMVMIDRLAEKNGLSEYLTSEEDVVNYFEVIGNYLPNELCEQLSQRDQLLTPTKCTDASQYLQSVRNRLQSEDSTLTDEEIEDAVELARQETENTQSDFNALSGADISDLMPTFYQPGNPDAVVSEYPSFLQKEINTTAKDLFQQSRLSYSNAMEAYVPAMAINIPADPEPGHPDYAELQKLRLEAALSQLSMYTMSLEKQNTLVHRYITEQIGDQELSIEGASLREIEERRLVTAIETLFGAEVTFNGADPRSVINDLSELMFEAKRYSFLSREQRDEEWVAEGAVTDRNDEDGNLVEDVSLYASPARPDMTGLEEENPLFPQPPLEEQTIDSEIAFYLAQPPLLGERLNVFDPFKGALQPYLKPSFMGRWDNVREYFGDAFAFRAVAAVIPQFAEEGREFIDSMLDTPSGFFKYLATERPGGFGDHPWEWFGLESVGLGYGIEADQRLQNAREDDPIWREEWAYAFMPLSQISQVYNLTKTGHRWDLDYSSEIMRKKASVSCISHEAAYKIYKAAQRRLVALQYDGETGSYNTLGNILLLYSSFTTTKVNNQLTYKKHIVKNPLENIEDPPPPPSVVFYDRSNIIDESPLLDNIGFTEPDAYSLENAGEVLLDGADIELGGDDGFNFDPRIEISSRGYLAGVAEQVPPDNLNQQEDRYIGTYPEQVSQQELSNPDNQVLLEIIPLEGLMRDVPQHVYSRAFRNFVQANDVDDLLIFPGFDWILPPLALGLNPIPGDSSRNINPGDYIDSTVSVYKEIIKELTTPEQLKELGINIRNGNIDLAPAISVIYVMYMLTYNNELTDGPEPGENNRHRFAEPNRPKLINLLSKRLRELSDVINGVFRDTPTAVTPAHMIILQNALQNENISKAFEDSKSLILSADFGPYTPSVKVEEYISKRYYDRYDVKISSDYHIGQATSRNEKVFKYCDSLPQSVYELIQPTPDEDRQMFSKRKAFTNLLNSIYSLSFTPSEYSISVFTDPINLGSSNYYAKLTRDIVGNIEGLFKNAPLYDDTYAQEVKDRLTGASIFIPGDRCVKNRYQKTDDSVIPFDRVIIPDPNIEITKEMSKPENAPENQSFDEPGGFEKGLQNLSLIAFVRVCLMDTMLKGGIAYSIWDMAPVASEEIFVNYCIEHVKFELSRNNNFKNIWKTIIERVSEITNPNFALEALVREELKKFPEYSRRVFNPTRRPQDAYDWYLDNFVKSVHMSNDFVTLSPRAYFRDFRNIQGAVPRGIFFTSPEELEFTGRNDFGEIGSYRLSVVNGEFDQRKINLFIEEYVRIRGALASKEVLESVGFRSRLSEIEYTREEEEIWITRDEFNHLIRQARRNLEPGTYSETLEQTEFFHGKRLMMLVPWDQSDSVIRYDDRNLHDADKASMRNLSSFFTQDGSLVDPSLQGSIYDASNFLRSGTRRVFAKAVPGTGLTGTQSTQVSWIESEQLPANYIGYFQAASIQLTSVENELNAENCSTVFYSQGADSGLNDSFSMTLQQKLKQSEMFQNMFEHFFPIKRFITMHSLFSTAVLSGYNTLPEVLSPVKNSISSIASLASMSTTEQHDVLSDPGQVEFQNFFTNNFPASDPKEALCFDFPLPGAGFFEDFIEALLKAMYMMPSIILRGIASQLDPAYKEMRQHYLNCDIEELMIHKAIEYNPYESIDRRLVNGLSLRGKQHKTDSGRYHDVAFGASADFVAWLFNNPFKWGSRSSRWALKIVSYAYSGNRPFIDASVGFRIPCKDSSPDWVKGGKYDSGRYGRFGHPLSPLTLLALSTPHLESDEKLKERLCIPNITSFDDCEDE